MYLLDVLNLMYVKGTSMESSEIVLKGYTSGRTIYTGTVKKLIEYISSHDDLKIEDGFNVNCKCIKSFSVVEIQIDRSNHDIYDTTPDYNWRKIITIM